MPDLPTLTLTQGQYDRVVAAFPGVDLSAKAAAYRAWLTNNLITFVRSAEVNRLTIDFEVQKAAAISALDSTLPPKLPYPPP